MLSLTRCEGEKIRIRTSDGDIWVIVTRTDRGRTTLAFECDKTIPIHREEVLPGLEWYQQPEQQKAV